MIKVLILTIKNPGNIFLVNKIMENFNVVGRVKLVTKKKKKKEVYRLWAKRIHKNGFLKTINKLLLVKLQNKLWNDDTDSRDFFFKNNQKTDYKYGTDEIVTENINSDEVAEFIMKRNPDVIAVCGSNIIKPKNIQTCS